jgi:hypothetical protein
VVFFTGGAEEVAPLLPLHAFVHLGVPQLCLSSASQRSFGDVLPPGKMILCCWAVVPTAHHVLPRLLAFYLGLILYTSF